MKILYAIQGTGNGHISRARAIIPALQQHGQTDLLISGTQADVDLPYEVKYRLHGLCFVFGKKGGIDYVETYKRSRVKRLFREISELPVEDYDVVISDFEPVSAWACRLRNKPCVGLSHQLAVVSKKAPQPGKTDLVGQAVLKYYAPTDLKFGFHFLPYGKNIFTPVIRPEVRNLQPADNRHYTVYLPAYNDDRILRFLSRFPEVSWEVFSKHCFTAYQEGNIHFFPITNEDFIESMRSAKGVLCGAGFETPAEVMYLQKKLLVVPMKGQYEQQCNAVALQQMGVPVIKSLKSKHADVVAQWLESRKAISVDYPDETEDIIGYVLKQYQEMERSGKPRRSVQEKPADFRDMLLQKIFYRTIK